MAYALPKPRIRRARYMQVLVRDPILGWSCIGAGVDRCGTTPRIAYERWKAEQLARYEEHLVANPPKTFAQVFSEVFANVFGGSKEDYSDGGLVEETPIRQKGNRS